MGERLSFFHVPLRYTDWQIKSICKYAIGCLSVRYTFLVIDLQIFYDVVGITSQTGRHGFLSQGIIASTHNRAAPTSSASLAGCDIPTVPCGRPSAGGGGLDAAL